MKANEKRNSMAKERGASSRWVTTDDEERALRRERAREEALRVRPLSAGRRDLFSDYEVSRMEGGRTRFRMWWNCGRWSSR